MKQILLSIFLSFYACVVISQSSISPAKAEFDVNEPKVFNYAGGTGDAQDWIGVYPLDTVPDGTPPSLTWQYISSPSGTLSLNGDNQAAPLVAGTYAVHLFCCNGYSILASSTFKVVGEAPASMSIVSYPFFGDSVNFSFSGGTGSPKDWIGIYLKDEDPNVASSITYEYVDGVKEGTKKISADALMVDTEYDAHLLCCDGYNSIVKTTFKVYDELQPNLQKQGDFPVGGPYTFAHQGGTGSLTDWVGVYNQGDTPGTDNSIEFLYVAGPNGTVTFDSIPELEQGKFYDAHFFCCDGYDIIASILGFQIGSSSTKDIDQNLFKAAGALNSAILFFDKSSKGKVDFINAMGQSIKSIDVSGENVLSVNDLPSGIMLAKYSTDKSEYTVKIVIR